jgi:hypothetical protein
MMAILRLAIFLLSSWILMSSAAARSAGPWTQLALADLNEMYRLIAANHPGPVDPENPRFRDWFEEGLRLARQKAAGAASFSDYKRVLEFYSSGFADAHVQVGFPVSARRQLWPGIITVLASDQTLVVGLSHVESVPTGAKVVSCDGIEARRLLEDRVYPYGWNRVIPHHKSWLATRLLVIDATDRLHRLRSCDVEHGAARQHLALDWKSIRAEESSSLRSEALGWVTPELGLRRADGVWLASIPSFNWQSDAEVARFRSFLADLAGHSAEIRRGTLVLDVRGNGGGNSDWGVEVAKVIWGPAWVERVQRGFDDTVDWRVSPDNIARNREAAEDLARAGLTELAATYRKLATDMEAARAAGRELMRVEGQPRPVAAVPPPDPVTGEVYLLTDWSCGSACLDFVDIVRRLPGVRHIGLPTAADSVYLELGMAGDLPSGLAVFAYPLKVYRNRARGNNEWYEPEIKWPGGRMTDEAVVQWVSTLH